MAEVQNLKNHARVVPMYHFWTLIPLTVNFGWSIYQLREGISGNAVVHLIVAAALIVGFLALRLQVLTVQDRVIRLEMRLRLAALLPASMHPSIARLSPKQLVALRFAGDTELPDLVQKVLAGQLTSQKAIKAEVKDWQADHLRA
jgi:hypothetical protein